VRHRRLHAALIGLAVLTLGPAVDSASARSYRFAYRPPQVGDRAVQDVHFEMNLIVTLIQSGQIVHTNDRGIQRMQRRTITVLDVEGGRVTRAKVAFARSEQSASNGSKRTTPEEHPVAGKAYLVTREPNGRLQVTDLQGSQPSAEERALVARAMDALGRRNPLALFFNQRTVAVGQTVSLPKDLANDLIGFREAVGEVSRFDMKLVAARVSDGGTCVVFDTRIDAGSPLEDGRTLAMRGQFLLEVDTCHAAAIELSCPVAVTETRGPEGGRFTVEGQGTLQVSMRSRRAEAVTTAAPR